jgi:hypothetical protein
MTRLAETTAASPLPVTVVKGLKLVAALGATGVIFRMKRERERERERESGLDFVGAIKLFGLWSRTKVLGCKSSK